MPEVEMLHILPVPATPIQSHNTRSKSSVNTGNFRIESDFPPDPGFGGLIWWCWGLLLTLLSRGSTSDALGTTKGWDQT